MIEEIIVNKDFDKTSNSIKRQDAAVDTVIMKKYILELTLTLTQYIMACVPARSYICKIESN